MADIVVRGIEIPKEPTNITIYPDGCWCNYTSNDSHGKFVVLPEGHGKLIDIKDVKSEKFHIEGRAEMYSVYNIGWNDALDAVCMYANSIVPAEGGSDDEHV